VAKSAGVPPLRAEQDQRLELDESGAGVCAAGGGSRGHRAHFARRSCSRGRGPRPRRDVTGWRRRPLNGPRHCGREQARRLCAPSPAVRASAGPRRPVPERSWGAAEQGRDRSARGRARSSGGLCGSGPGQQPGRRRWWLVASSRPRDRSTGASRPWSRVGPRWRECARHESPSATPRGCQATHGRSPPSRGPAAP
jgi:hypothetical protein